MRSPRHPSYRPAEPLVAQQADMRDIRTIFAVIAMGRIDMLTDEEIEVANMYVAGEQLRREAMRPKPVVYRGY